MGIGIERADGKLHESCSRSFFRASGRRINTSSPRRADGHIDVDQRRAAARPLLARLCAWARAEYRSRSTGDPMKTAVGYVGSRRGEAPVVTQEHPKRVNATSE
jgi:hypothetical protein